RDHVPALSDTSIFDRGDLDRFPGPGPGTLEDRFPHHSGSGLGRGPAASHREIANQQLMTKTSLDKTRSRSCYWRAFTLAPRKNFRPTATRTSNPTGRRCLGKNWRTWRRTHILWASVRPRSSTASFSRTPHG